MTTTTPEAEIASVTPEVPEEEMGWGEFKRLMEETSLSSRPRFDDEWYERNGQPKPAYMTEDEA